MEAKVQWILLVFSKILKQQFNESQRKYTQLWEESQKQLIESQKKLMNTWNESFSAEETQANFTKNFEKTQNFQRELINSSLHAQQEAVRLAVEAQKEFWDKYFQTTHKMVQASEKLVVVIHI